MHQTTLTLIITRLRDNATPYPGRVTEVSDKLLPTKQHDTIATDNGIAIRRIELAIDGEPRWMRLWDSAQSRLTPRQKQVVDEIIAGGSIAEAARRLGMSRVNLYNYLKKKFKKRFAQCLQAYNEDLK